MAYGPLSSGDVALRRRWSVVGVPFLRLAPGQPTNRIAAQSSLRRQGRAKGDEEYLGSILG